MKPLGTALRLSVGIGAITFLVWRVDLQRAWETLAGAVPVWLLLALGAQLGAKTCWIRRWQALLGSAGHRLAFLELFRLILVGLFFNNFLPTSVGGDLVRALGLRASGVSRTTGLASVLADRLVGLLALGLMAVVGGGLGMLLWPEDRSLWLASLIFAVCVVILIVIVTHPEALLRFERLPIPGVAGEKLRRGMEAVSLLSGRRPVVLRALAFSLALSAFSALYHWAIARALGIPVPFPAWFVIVPAVMLFAALPITLNGLGIRELGFVGLLGARGVPPDAAAVFALLAFVGTLGFALAGGAVFLAGRGRATGERTT